jgi:hypothetical protein
MAFRARLSAKDCVPCRSGSIACPIRAQNSIWPAIERSNNSLVILASRTRPVDSRTGWLIAFPLVIADALASA